MLELSGNSSPKGKVLREPFKVELKESRESCSSYVKKRKLGVGGGSTLKGKVGEGETVSVFSSPHLGTLKPVLEFGI